MDNKKQTLTTSEKSDVYSERNQNYLRRNFSPATTIHQSSYINEKIQPSNLLQPKNYTRDIFEGKVPVRIRTQSNTELDSILNIKIYEEICNNVAYSVFRLTDERDLQFMKILQLTESKFAQLKKEQRLQMGFEQFAEKFVELISRCHVNEMNYKASFGCILDLSQEEPAFFKIIEKNEFKEFDHLVLEFSQPTDQVIKAYLSNCLFRSLAIENELSERVNFLECELESYKKLSNSLQNNLNSITEENNNEQNKLREDYEKQLKDLRNAHDKSLADSQEKLHLVETKLTSKYTDREKMLQEELQSLDSKYKNEKERADAFTESNRELTLQRDSLQDQLARIESKNNYLQSDLQTLQDKITILEKDNTQLKNDIQLKDRSLNEKEDAYKQIQEKIELYKDLLNKSEAMIEEYKKSIAKHEKKLADSSNEIIKANELLESMQDDIDKRKNRNQLLKAKITKQESRISELEAMNMNFQKEKEKLLSELEDRDKKINQKNIELEGLRHKAEELENTIKEKQDMIDYHNKRLSEEDRSNKYYKYLNHNITDSISNRISNTTQKLLNEGMENMNLTKTYKYKSEFDNDKERTDSIYKSKYGDNYNNESYNDKYEVKMNSISKDFARFDIKNIKSTYEGDLASGDTKQHNNGFNNNGNEEVGFPVPRPIKKIPFNVNKHK